MTVIFRNVSKRYNGGREALKNVSFTLERGEMAFLTGHSGAGKSTLLRLISLIERSSGGEIIVNDKHYNQISARKIPAIRQNMGVILQNPRLLNDRSVFDNVAIPLQIAGFRYFDIAKRVRAALDMVGLLSKEKMRPQHLSGGEQQRVGIARAVVHKPSLLLADEPTGNLDPKLSSEVMKLFSQFNEVGVTVLVASHDLSLIATLRHRIITLRQGVMM